MTTLKTIFLLFALSFGLFISKGNAQLTLSPSSTIIRYQGYNQLFYDSIHIANPSATDTLKLQWELLQYDTLDGTYSEFCSSGNCWLGFPQTGSFMPIAPGGFGWAGVHLWTGNTSVTSVAKIWLYKKGMYGFGDTLTYILHSINDVGITNSKQENHLEIYPNPVENILNLHAIQVNSEISIFNIQGGKVFSKLSSSENETLDVENLKSGVYLVQIIGKFGVSTAKFIKN